VLGFSCFYTKKCLYIWLITKTEISVISNGKELKSLKFDSTDHIEAFCYQEDKYAILVTLQ